LNRSRFDTLPTLELLKYVESEAERGQLPAQVRLGLVRKTDDGKWIAPQDNSYNVKWLEMAQKQGSKTATWELVYIKRREFTHEDYLRAMMAAAEEGNPWAASILMDLTSGRLGENRKPTSCLEEIPVDKKCAPPELLPISTTRKWAEIAAEGGDANAQNWLCGSAAGGNPEHGQPQDDKAAFKWCQIAVHNACSFWSNRTLADLIKNGTSDLPANIQEVNRILKLENQPWRKPRGYFFPQPPMR
jgi:TPR repeat protein